MKPYYYGMLSPWGHLHDLDALTALLKAQGVYLHQNQFPRTIRTQCCVGVTGRSTGNHFSSGCTLCSCLSRPGSVISTV